MKTRPMRHQVWSRLLFVALPLFFAACGGPPHLQRPLTFPPGTVFPPSIAAAQKAIAEAKAAGAANVLDARYPLARAEAYLLNALEEFEEGDPTDIIDQFAKVALDAANEALRIARQARS